MNNNEILVEIKKIREFTCIEIAEPERFQELLTNADDLLEKLEKTLEEEETPEHFCMNYGGDDRKCDCKEAPVGRCEKCNHPLQACEAHFNNGRYCDNPDCEECIP